MSKVKVEAITTIQPMATITLEQLMTANNMNHDLIKQLQSLSPTEGEGGYVSLRTSEDHEKLMKLAIPMRQEILAMAKEIEECKEVISELLHTYVINLNDNGHPNASITDILKLMDRATKLTPQPK